MTEEAEATDAAPSLGLWLGVLAFVLAFGAAGYAWRGNFQALAMSPGDAAISAAERAQTPAPAQIAAMVQRLATKLQAEPNDPVGWAMLGRSYSVMGQYPQALAAFRKVVELQPKDAQAYADLADATGMANGQKLDGPAQQLIQQALALDPNNAKALGLAGTVAFDQGDAVGAAGYWQRALAQVEPGTELAIQLRDAVDAARQRARLPPLAAASAASATATTAATSPSLPAVVGPGLRVRVTLSPALAAQARPDEVVYIFARAAPGNDAAPKMPLAIQRRQVKDLPLDITLDDSMAMSPAAKLSSQSQVVVGARISKSGNPLPQPGDLQGLSDAIASSGSKVNVEIGAVVR